MDIDVKINTGMEVNQTQREALIREYERRIAVLKSGGSPSAVTFRRGRTAESEITGSGDKTKCRNSGDGTKTISSEWTAKENGREIAEISFQIKALPGFKNEDTGMILHHFADMSHSFYLKAGNALKAAKPENVSMEDMIRNCITEMFREWAANTKDGGRIVLTEDDLREAEKPDTRQEMK